MRHEKEREKRRLEASATGARIPGSDHEPGSRCAVVASRSNSRDAVSARYRDTTHESRLDHCIRRK
jgi:hypothetical protein